MRRVIAAPVVRVIGALVSIVLAYWFGLVAIERLPAGYGVLILLLVPTIGLVVLLLALPLQARRSQDEDSPSAFELAARVRRRYKGVK